MTTRIPQLIPRRLLRHSHSQIHHPAVLEEAKTRSQKIHLQLADHITTFAGSMNFVWIHVGPVHRVDSAIGNVPMADTGPGGVT